MIKKYLLLWALTLLTACSTLPNIEALPEVKTDSLTFKVEQLSEQQVKQTSLLTVQFQPDQWRTTTQCKTLNINECGCVASTKYGDLPTEWSFFMERSQTIKSIFYSASRWQSLAN